MSIHPRLLRQRDGLPTLGMHPFDMARVSKRNQPLNIGYRQIGVIFVNFFERGTKLGILNNCVGKNASAAIHEEERGFKLYRPESPETLLTKEGFKLGNSPGEVSPS